MHSYIFLLGSLGQTTAKHVRTKPDNSIISKKCTIKDIDFTSAWGKKHALDDQIKAAVDAEDTCDVETGESEQPKKMVKFYRIRTCFAV